MIGQSIEKMAESVGKAFKSMAATGAASGTSILNVPVDSSPQHNPMSTNYGN